MASKILPTLALVLLLATSNIPSAESKQAGKWRLLKKSIGVSAMHMALLPNDKIVVFDRTNSGPSNLSLPESKCSSNIQAAGEQCTAHSVEFDASDRAVRPLTILTDTWCSSGALSHDGILIQTGGFEAGERVVRFIRPCEGCDWVEIENGLTSSRWYASNQVLPDGKIIVVGGKSQFTYEFVPKSSDSDKRVYSLPFLEETRYSPKVPNNLYPFLHLSPDGTLFVFANNRAISLDYAKNRVVRSFPAMPLEGNNNDVAVSRNYPSTGSSALLPIYLSRNGTGFESAVVLICGGTPADSNLKATAGEFIPAVKSCGRIEISAKDPVWEMMTMPIERVMGDMILLPTGDVLIINGAKRGTAGWTAARDPALAPVLYKSGIGSKTKPETTFETMSPSSIPRLYHSTAHLLSDGRVLVGGSNPNRNYNFSSLFPTELSLEAFYPPYLTGKSARPAITSVRPGRDLEYKGKVSVRFRWKHTIGNEVFVTMVAPSFTTHSLAMNQRLLVLEIGEIRKGKSGCDYAAESHAPGTRELAPPGYYLLFVVVNGVPSRGVWVRIK